MSKFICGDILLATHRILGDSFIMPGDFIIISEIYLNSYGMFKLTPNLQTVTKSHSLVPFGAIDSFIKIGCKGKIDESLAKVLYV